MIRRTIQARLSIHLYTKTTQAKYGLFVCLSRTYLLRFRRIQQYRRHNSKNIGTLQGRRVQNSSA
jgi:hypothetical protein